MRRIAALLLTLHNHRREIEKKLILWMPLILLACVLLFFFRSEGALQESQRDQLALISSASSLLSQGIFESIRELSVMSAEFEKGLANIPTAIAIAQLQKQFFSAAELNNQYLQLRWIDTNGKERLRIDQGQTGPRIIAATNLQDKSDRYYFQNCMELVRGETYISPWDLNQEHGKIQVPYSPVIRIGQPLFRADGIRAGILIINLDAGNLIRGLDALARDWDLGFFLVDEEGEWIKGEKERDSWSGDLDRAEPISERYPDLWEAIASEGAGEFTGEGGHWVFSRFSFRIIGLSTNWKIQSPSWWLISRLQTLTILGLHGQSFLEALALLILGWITVFLIIVRQVAEQHEKKELEASLRNTRSRLIRAERLSSIGLLMAGLSHELNTPIGAAQLMTSSLMSELQPPEGNTATSKDNPVLLEDRTLERIVEGLNLVSDCLERVAELVRTFKKMSVDRESMELRWFDLAEIVGDVARIMDRAVREKDHRLEVDVKPGIKIYGAPGPLSQVLQILLSNALEHAFPLPGGSLSIKAASSDRTCYISVSDNGSGIDPDTITRVFDPFYTTGRGKGHTGIGLSIAQELVNSALQGQINVRSSRKGGTRFRIAIPLKAQPIKSSISG